MFGVGGLPLNDAVLAREFGCIEPGLGWAATSMLCALLTIRSHIAKVRANSNIQDEAVKDH